MADRKKTNGYVPAGYPLEQDSSAPTMQNPKKCRRCKKGTRPRSAKDRGCLEGCLAALCCCCLLDECCCDPTLIIYG